MLGTVQEQIAYWQSEIKRAVREELSYADMVFEHFEQRIFQNIRWGFQRFNPDSNKDLGWTSLLELNIPEFIWYEISLLGDAYEEHGFKRHMFDIEHVPLAHVKLDFDFDHSQVSVERELNRPFELNTTEFLSKWKLVAMLPPPFVVFDFDDSYSGVQEWQWEYVEQYENWFNKHHEHKRRLSRQVGGWADFRQDGDYSTYIAQANTEHGDYGAVYLSYQDEQFHGYEQMC
jgi:hypothetical protein